MAMIGRLSIYCSFLQKWPACAFWLPLTAFMFDPQWLCVLFGLWELKKNGFYLILQKLLNLSLIMSSTEKKNVDDTWMNIQELVKSFLISSNT